MRQSTVQIDSLTQELETTQRALSAVRETAAREQTEGAETVDALRGDLRKVRERARELMSARDAEVAALKTRLRSGEAGVPESAPTTVADDAAEFFAEPPIETAEEEEGERASLLPASGEATAPGVEEQGDAVELLREVLAALGRWAGNGGVSGGVDEVGAVLDTVGRALAAAEGQKARLVELDSRLATVTEELAESEHTHELRDRATDVLKEELAQLRRDAEASGVDTVYLKGVLIAAFESGELTCPKSVNTALTIISRLLHFSDAEVQRCKKPANVKRRSSATGPAIFGGLFG
jgi:hypothetical protein